MTVPSRPLEFVGERPSTGSVWLQAIRPKTLFAAAAPVLIGSSLAVNDGVFHLVAATCALLSALLIQVGTNFYNDYADAKKGADTAERIGPLRVTQAGLVSQKGMMRATLIAFGLAVAAGSYLMFRGGLPIVAIGTLSILFGFLYSASRFSLSSFGIADLSVLLFFGPVAVGGTYFVQALVVPMAVVVAGLAPGLLATGILVVNNVRDIEQDMKAERPTLVVRFGRSFGIYLYSMVLVIAALVPVFLFAVFGFRPTVMIASLILVPTFPMVSRLAASSDGVALNELLASTGKLLFAYSILFAFGVLIG